MGVSSSCSLARHRQSGIAGLQAGGRQRHVATAAGADYSRQHHGPDGDLVDAAGLVADADDSHDHDDDREAAGSTVGGSATAAEQPAGASLKYSGLADKHRTRTQYARIQGLSSPLNVAYL